MDDPWKQIGLYVGIISVFCFESNCRDYFGKFVFQKNIGVSTFSLVNVLTRDETGYVYELQEDVDNALQRRLGKVLPITSPDGDCSYYIQGKIKLSRPRIALNYLPSQRRLLVTRKLTQPTRHHEVISHLGGDDENNKPWIVTNQRQSS